MPRPPSLALGVGLLLAGCCQPPPPPILRPPVQPESVAVWQAPPGYGCTLQGGRPDPVCTPGARNPAVTQATLAATGCTPNWTQTIRPPASYTTSLKGQQLADGYNLGGDLTLTAYEEDHFLPLVLGGHPRDPANLFPQPYSYLVDGRQLGAHQKDQLEVELHRRICLAPTDPDYLPLDVAQQAILTDWVTAWEQYVPLRSTASALGTVLDPDDED